MKQIGLTLAALLATAAAPVLAQSKGDMTFGVGVHNISPEAGNSNTTVGLINVDANVWSSAARCLMRAAYSTSDRAHTCMHRDVLFLYMPAFILEECRRFC